MLSSKHGEYMDIRFPLKDVRIKQVDVVQKVEDPVFSNDYMQINQHEFAMQVEGIANYYACNGSEVEYAIAPGAEKASVELYLNGSVYGAILYQRRIMPLHGSCFQFKGQGIMICGDSGAGKSALTASFCLDGARFLTDDVSPILIEDNKPFVLDISDRIKLWDDILEQLGQEKGNFQKINPESEKYYYPIKAATGKLYRLDLVYILEITEVDQVDIKEIHGPENFATLRGEVYRPEYLLGMPENEKATFKIFWISPITSGLSGCIGPWK